MGINSLAEKQLGEMKIYETSYLHVNFGDLSTLSVVSGKAGASIAAILRALGGGYQCLLEELSWNSDDQVEGPREAPHNPDRQSSPTRQAARERPAATATRF